MHPAERLIGFPHACGARVGGWRRRPSGLAVESEFRVVVSSCRRRPPPPLWWVSEVRVSGHGPDQSMQNNEIYIFVKGSRV